MIPVRRIAGHSSIGKSGYICLSCRLKSTHPAPRKKQDIEAAHTNPPQSLEAFGIGEEEALLKKKSRKKQRRDDAVPIGKTERGRNFSKIADAELIRDLRKKDTETQSPPPAREGTVEVPPPTKSRAVSYEDLWAEHTRTPSEADLQALSSHPASSFRLIGQLEGRLFRAYSAGDLNRVHNEESQEVFSPLTPRSPPAQRRHRAAEADSNFSNRRISNVLPAQSSDAGKLNSIHDDTEDNPRIGKITSRKPPTDPAEPSDESPVRRYRHSGRWASRYFVSREMVTKVPVASPPQALENRKTREVLDVLDAHRSSSEEGQAPWEAPSGALTGHSLGREHKQMYQSGKGPGVGSDVRKHEYAAMGRSSLRDTQISSYTPFSNKHQVRDSDDAVNLERGSELKEANVHQQLHPPTSLAKGRALGTTFGPRTSNDLSQRRPTSNIPLPSSHARVQARLMHGSRQIQQHTAAATIEPDDVPPPPSLNPSSIRTQLRQWQELHANPKEDFANRMPFDVELDTGEATNSLTRLPDATTSLRREDGDDAEERAAFAHFSKDHDGMTVDNGSSSDSRFLSVGDLVELDFRGSERESLLAVYVRRMGDECQCVTMQGKWVQFEERRVPYSIPGWISPSLVKPLLDYIPKPQNQEEWSDLKEQMYIEDLSVPRTVSAPLVSKLLQFHQESKEIYRRFASTLDDAHNILAHETDLRYGSLVSAATTLLQMPADKLPLTALFTVRSALDRAGFAFNFDPRSHRLTGYLQIRSKEQVKMVDFARGWIRDWQDDVAMCSAAFADGDGKWIKRHKVPKTAQYVYSFIDKARAIVRKSREDRQPMPQSGNIGPSKKRYPIAIGQDSVRATTDLQFSEQDTELVRFIEAWCCSNMLRDIPRLMALPPLLLQATGLYQEQDPTQPTGFLFLQELGTIMPYENRVRFDQHLLLPSSQHSKPLQHLMTSLLDLERHHDHSFTDTMQGLRHDWKDMHVYCIDDASATEIDDGLSIEKAGSGEWWVHIHVANPTAFFERDHPLAKMARHMGESIYMPERTYMMLPKWATAKHFSLGKDRPCLTFSAKLDAEGRVQDRKIQSGIIRNVLSLTRDEVGTLLQAEKKQHSDHTTRVLTVGGEVPQRKKKKSSIGDVNAEMVEQLKILNQLATKRTEHRKAAGGVFFDMHMNDTEVWQSTRAPGLAWDHPHRKGARTVEGDPVIQMRTRGFQNWFQPPVNIPDILVREMMMLACETAAIWCSERQIPVIFRGTIPKPDTPDPDRYMHEVMIPAAQSAPDGEIPMHLSVHYLKFLGKAAMQTTPLKHKVLGLGSYCKVTSPLRRYGDMIVHWQIEAALREEARTGGSLVTPNLRTANRNFLPFSSTVLDTIMLGLQPRESLITRAKTAANRFWEAMLLFRAHHFGEAELPFTDTAPSGKTLLRVFCHTGQVTNVMVGCLEMTLNGQATMINPERVGLGFAKSGDVWEAELECVDVYRRVMVVKPVRLVERAGER